MATWPRTADRGAVPRPPLPAAGSADRGPVPIGALSAEGGNNAQRWKGPLVSGPIRPERVVVPAAGVDAAVTQVTVSSDGQLGVPDDPRTLGWWAAGPEPGSARGSAVIDGHVDSAARGIGALFRMGKVSPGQQLAVVAREGSEVFTIDAVRQLTKKSLVSSGALDQGIGGRLVIITCGGRFDPATHAYRDNVVVFATPVVGTGTK